MSNIDKLKPGKYAILFRNNWDGEGDTYETFAILDAEGTWRDEEGDELLEYQGDEVLKAWPMDDGSNVLALLDELEAKDKLNAELMEKQRLIDICQGQGLEHRIAAEKRSEAAEKRNARVLELLNAATVENVWEIIGRLKVVISGEYRSDAEIDAGTGKGA